MNTVMIINTIEAKAHKTNYCQQNPQKTGLSYVWFMK